MAGCILRRYSFRGWCPRTSPGGTYTPDYSVPKGRLKIGRDAILDDLQVYPGLASWAKFSRPCGTKLTNPGSHTRSKGHKDDNLYAGDKSPAYLKPSFSEFSPHKHFGHDTRCQALKPNSLSILYGPERVGRPAKVCYVES